MPVTHVKKRDGSVVFFVKKKVANAIYKSFLETGQGDYEIAQKLAESVTNALNEKFVRKLPSVEDVQNAVEEVLAKNNYAETAKAYIIYRQRRMQIREAKKLFGLSTELKMSVNGAYVLEKRYLLKDKDGKVNETPIQLFQRVAKAIAAVDEIYGESADETKSKEKEFFEMMTNFEFLPNSPTLMNAGTALGQLNACFVLPVDDSIKSIFKTLNDTALIQRTGGGVGISFSHIRPRGEMIHSTLGTASGPVSFMRIFDVTADVMREGGRRRGALMGVLRIDHPNIIEFITAKGMEGYLSNFNLSVGITDDFMKAIEEDLDFNLVHPETKHAVRKMRARDLWHLIVSMSWQTGDPGLLFLDKINEHNVLPEFGRLETTNPCGEQPLLSYESCNLGSINLSKILKKRGDGKHEIDWDKLRKTVHNAVHFLDNVIDANKYPLPEIERITKANRKIGLGVMGFADMLIDLEISYNSQHAINIADQVMKFVYNEAAKASIILAEKRGPFPNFKHSILAEHHRMIRNATLTTIAPTGTLSIIAGCSSGIEPIFAVSYVRNMFGGTKMLEVNPYFDWIARERGLYTEELMARIAQRGSVQKIDDIPYDIKRIFVTAFDIDPEWHVRIQATFQKYTDNAVSKTVNLPEDASILDVEKVFITAYKLGCKGITIYRYGSKKEQILNLGSAGENEYVNVESEYAGGCPHEGYCGV